MAIRIYTGLEENERIKNELMSYVAQRTKLLQLWPKDCKPFTLREAMFQSVMSRLKIIF